MAATATSLAQMKSFLWSGRAARVHAVIDGARVPGLAARLATEDLPGWDCLQRGALDAASAARAAYVVELRAGAAFSDWLLDEASFTLPGWGVLGSSSRGLLDMREHFRSLHSVMLPDGNERTWRWFDPAVLHAFAELATPMQQLALMGPLQLLVAPSAEAWTCYTIEGGALKTEARRVSRNGS
jgi:hypothetical protein